MKFKIVYQSINDTPDCPWKDYDGEEYGCEGDAWEKVEELEDKGDGRSYDVERIFTDSVVRI